MERNKCITNWNGMKRIRTIFREFSKQGSTDIMESCSLYEPVKKRETMSNDEEAADNSS